MEANCECIYIHVPYIYRSQCDLEDSSDIPPPKVIKKKKYRKLPSFDENDIKDAIKQTSDLQKQIQTKLDSAGHTDMSPERQNWGHWMVSILPSIDERLWSRYELVIYLLLSLEHYLI